MRALWKNYGEDLVMAANRYHQIEVKNLMPYHLVKTEMVAYVNDSSYWVIYRKGNLIFRSFFAKNGLWFKALSSELEFGPIKELPQMYLI